MRSDYISVHKTEGIDGLGVADTALLQAYGEMVNNFTYLASMVCDDGDIYEAEIWTLKLPLQGV